VYNKSIVDNREFAILSGVFGLVKPEEKIPYYDYCLEERGVRNIKDKNIGFIE